MDINVHITDIVNQVLSSFDFTYMLVVNILTYLIIKIIDYFNGDRKVKTWIKRLVLIIAALTITIIYLIIGYEDKFMLINSTIVAPVFWSWVLKPILDKFGIGYKTVNNTLN